MAKPMKPEPNTNIFADPRQIQGQIIRGLRYFLVLHIVNTKPMHGYRLITLIRKSFGIYLGPSSIYPVLRDLEDWKYLESTWETDDYHPKRVYSLTQHGQRLLNHLEHSVGHILVGLSIKENSRKTAETPKHIIY